MIELNKIYCESNLETMSRMPDNFVDLTVTSPPYDGLRDYNGYSFPFEEIAKELFRVTKQGGVVVWVVGDASIDGSETGTSFKQALFFMECGFRLHDTMIYEKNNFMPLNHRRYEQCFEYMFVLTKGKHEVFNPLKTHTITSQFRKPEKVRGAGLDPKSKTAKRAKIKPHHTKEDKILRIPAHYSPRMIAPAYVMIDDNITFNINRAQITEDNESVCIKVGMAIIHLTKSTKTTKINLR